MRFLGSDPQKRSSIGEVSENEVFALKGCSHIRKIKINQWLSGYPTVTQSHVHKFKHLLSAVAHRPPERVQTLQSPLHLVSRILGTLGAKAVLAGDGKVFSARLCHKIPILLTIPQALAAANTGMLYH